MDHTSRNSKRPAATAFKQQQLKAWQPILTPVPVIITFLVVGIVFIPIGVVLLLASNSVVEVTQRYDQKETCAMNSKCTLTIEIPQKMEAPVYLYYQLENYYQNHRRYVKSRNDNQLRGDIVTSYSALADCDPLKSVDGSQQSQDCYLPCGLIAASIFNDTYVLRHQNTTIPLRKEGIAWSSDVKEKFHNPPSGAPGVRIIPDFQDEDFIVWMRTAGLPKFKKLYRIIDNDLDTGTYQVDIMNNYPVESFGGKKYVVLSTTSWIGGKNNFLGWAYIVVGIICFVQGVVFALKHKISPRKLGDTKYLDWNK